jgi:hypothetical protein
MGLYPSHFASLLVSKGGEQRARQGRGRPVLPSPRRRVRNEIAPEPLRRDPDANRNSNADGASPSDSKNHTARGQKFQLDVVVGSRLQPVPFVLLVVVLAAPALMPSNGNGRGAHLGKIKSS